MSGGVFKFKRHLVRAREDSEPYDMVPDEIKLLMMKIVVESKATKEKKRRLNSVDEDEESVEGEEATNLQGQRGFGSKGKEGSASSESVRVQATLNQLMKKIDKHLVDAQVANFFLHKCLSIQCH